MKILFIHQNFPGQFRHLAPALAADRNNMVLAMTMQRLSIRSWQGVKLVPYAAQRTSSRDMHPWVRDIETKTIRGEACYRAALALKKEGFVPDLVIAHPGWGESLFIKEVWPDAPLGIYCEYYYQSHGADVGFDPEFPDGGADAACRLQLRNVNNLLHFQITDAGLAPTLWQAATFPEPFRSKITVIHDGIDSDSIAPDDAVRVVIDQQRFSRNDELITFVNRNLEPYRGYHVFIRALPALLRRRPAAHVVIVGGDKVSYGAAPPAGESWKQHFIDEVRPLIADHEWKRVHFLPHLPHDGFVKVLQLSTVHVYLTYPFVLSWSLLEAMSAGCAIVASDTAPVREVLTDHQNGVLTGFFDGTCLVDRVCALLDDQAERQRLGGNAREFVRNSIDLKRHALPRQLQWVASLLQGD